jgi:hypothetical protein
MGGPEKKCTVARATVATAVADTAAVAETRGAATAAMTGVAIVTEIAVAMIEAEVAIEVATVVEDSFKDHVCQLWPKVRPLSYNQIISDLEQRTQKEVFLSTK